MTVRDRRRRRDGNIETAPVPANVAADPNVVRLLLVLRMLAQGRSQCEIAAHFEKDVRTIRRWIGRAKELGIAVSDQTTPQVVVDEVLNRFAELRADVLDLKKQAEVRNDAKLVLRCVAELRNLVLAEVAALGRIGFFDNFTFPPPFPPNPRAALAEQVFMAEDDGEPDLGDQGDGPTIEGEVSDD